MLTEEMICSMMRLKLANDCLMKSYRMTITDKSVSRSRISYSLSQWSILYDRYGRHSVGDGGGGTPMTTEGWLTIDRTQSFQVEGPKK